MNLDLKRLDFAEKRKLQMIINKAVYADTRGLEDERDILADTLTKAMDYIVSLENVVEEHGIAYKKVEFE